MQGRSTRTWQGVAGMLVTVLCSCAHTPAAAALWSGLELGVRAEMAAVSTRKFHLTPAVSNLHPFLQNFEEMECVSVVSSGKNEKWYHLYFH